MYHIISDRKVDARSKYLSSKAVFIVAYPILRSNSHVVKTLNIFLISNFRRVLNIVCILLGVSPASDCGLPTFRNPLSVPSSRLDIEYKV